MQEHNKTYGRFYSVQTWRGVMNLLILSDALLGFTISLYEFQATVPTLWDTVKSKSICYTLYRGVRA